MRHFSYALGAALLLTGCASQEYTGQGEYFELHNINVIERDLSVFKPTQMVSTKPEIKAPEQQTVLVNKTKKAVQKKAVPVPQFDVRPGERYQAALTRWLRASGLPNVAWSMQDAHLSVMDEITEKPLRFKGTLKQAVNELSNHLQVPIQVIMDKRHHVAGVYDFEGQARITHVSGDSIKAVTKRVVENYGLRWDDSDGLSRSWLAENDYKFGADYYLLTAKDDIATALTTVLEDFPVHSSIVESTGQVIIQEEL